MRWPIRFFLSSALFLICSHCRAEEPGIQLVRASSPIFMALFLGTIALMPFAFAMVTSFLKISVVLSMLRSALGTPQIPPNIVVTGLAMMLSVFVMMPVAEEICLRIDESPAWNSLLRPSPERSQHTAIQPADLLELVNVVRQPMIRFLQKHAGKSEMENLSILRQQIGPTSRTADDVNSDLQILIPAFALTELKEAFQLGFLLFLPFIVVDMVVANILTAMGMVMLSPTTISLPFKLLLFVLADGWSLLVSGLIQGYLV